VFEATVLVGVEEARDFLLQGGADLQVEVGLGFGVD
jgi:hypothetical protein